MSSFSATETNETCKRSVQIYPQILPSKVIQSEIKIKTNFCDELKIVADKSEKMEKQQEGVNVKVEETAHSLFRNNYKSTQSFVSPKIRQLFLKNSEATQMPITLPTNRISSSVTIMSAPVASKSRNEEPWPYVTIEKKPTTVGHLLVSSSETKQAVVFHPKLLAKLQKSDSTHMDNPKLVTKQSKSILLKPNQTTINNLSDPITNIIKSPTLFKCNQEDDTQLSPRHQRSKSLTSNELNKFPRKLSSSSDCGTAAIKPAQNDKNDFQPIKFNFASEVSNNADEDSPLIVDAADFEKITEGKVIETCSIDSSQSSVLLCDENVDTDFCTPTSNESVKNFKTKQERINNYKTLTKASPLSTLTPNLINELSMLTWSNGIGQMNHSKLAFEMNEFSLLEVHENHIFRDRVSTHYELPLSKRTNLTNMENSMDPLFLCRSCNCHGAAVDFLAPFFCSLECVTQSVRNKRQGRSMPKGFDTQEKSQQLPKPGESTLIKNRGGRKTIQYETPIPDQSSFYKLQNIEKNFSTKTFQWGSYLKEQNAKMAIVDLFLNPFPSDSNHFEIGMKLEAIDPENNSLFCVCSIVDKKGYRLKLHFDGYSRKFDFWVNADSMDIFPPGWCSKTERILQPPRIMSLLSFNWPTYLNRCNALPAPRHLFTHLKSSSSTNPFRIGMKLEAEDLKNTRRVCVASVIDVLDNRILIRFDGWSERYDYWVDISSPYIFPVGWHSTQGLKLVVPPDWSTDFSWSNYLKSTNSVAADENIFCTREPIKFERGMRLEIVDKKNPTLIRPATIQNVDDYELKIIFDGWPESFSFWVADDSPDIHPVGWCELTGHDLEPPPGYDSKLPITMPCPIRGCRGVGNAKKFEIDFHATADSCPYEKNNWKDESEKPSRFDDNEKGIVCDNEITPLSINKKRKSSLQNRDLDVEPLIKQTKRESISKSPEPTENVNIELPIMVAKKFLCDYGPRLKQNYDIWCKNSKWLRKTIAGITDKNPLKWTVEETAVYIEALPSCNSIAEIFRNNEIDGEALLSMRQSDLTTHLKLKVGPAMKIFSLITNLRGDVVQFHRL